jgi:hypothetical protein
MCFYPNTFLLIALCNLFYLALQHLFEFFFKFLLHLGMIVSTVLCPLPLCARSIVVGLRENCFQIVLNVRCMALEYVAVAAHFLEFSFVDNSDLGY